MKLQASKPADIQWAISGTSPPCSGEISTGLAHTPFGSLFLAWTNNFLLEAGFQEINPGLRLSPTAQELANLILSNSPLPIRPLAIGTPFQIRVWQSLTHIPFGTTASYRDIAHAINSPKASRAVGTAIGTNRLALLIPCHRVIRHNGHIGGFGWGVPTKRKLLAHEQQVIQNIDLSRPGQ